VKISLLMDVEDPIDPISDDAAKECADILRELGVPGTFMVVGEKARKLIERGRRDVIAALNRHAVGLHSDMHSLHPVVLEYLHGLSWEQGVDEALRREGRGVEAIRAAFGREPCAWAGPGNIWGPQISEACRRMGILAVVYALTEIRNRDMHRFLGVLHYTHGLGVPDQAYDSRDMLDARLQSLFAEIQEHMDAGVEWLEVYIGHPTRIFHKEFWDAVNFEGGRMPPPSEWECVPRKSAESLDEVLGNFRYAIARIRDLEGVDLISIDNANALFGAATPQPVDAEEIAAMWPAMERRLRSMAGWIIMPPDFDLTDVVEFTRARLSTLQRIRLFGT
jgi:hypothetical protein